MNINSKYTYMDGLIYNESLIMLNKFYLNKKRKCKKKKCPKWKGGKCNCL